VKPVIRVNPTECCRWGAFTVIGDEQVPADEVWIATEGGSVRWRLRSDAVVLKQDGSFTVTIPEDLAGYAGLKELVMPPIRKGDYAIVEPCAVVLDFRDPLAERVAAVSLSPGVRSALS